MRVLPKTPSQRILDDDQEGSGEVLRMFLTCGGYVVKEASGGLEAVNLATNDRPNLYESREPLGATRSLK
jgi:CheY-like chemotaxis protein